MIKMVDSIVTEILVSVAQYRTQQIGNSCVRCLPNIYWVIFQLRGVTYPSLAPCMLYFHFCPELLLLTP